MSIFSVPDKNSRILFFSKSAPQFILQDFSYNLAKHITSRHTWNQKKTMYFIYLCNTHILIKSFLFPLFKKKHFALFGLKNIVCSL